MADGERFRDEDVTLAGVRGELFEAVSANPVNHHEAIIDPVGCTPITIDGKLFIRDPSVRSPLVVVVPGSLGVGPNHRAHAERLIEDGIAVLLLDPFGARSVTSTVADQIQYSFAASAFDVLAALRELVEHPAVDPARISAQGHSRGGAAVLIAAMRRFADPIVGSDVGLAGAYGVYPWCGHQFRDPDVGSTVVRIIVGDQDDWVSVQQAQAQIHAVEVAGGDATMRIVGGAAHSFDRLEPVHELADAVVAPTAPTVFLEDDGAVIDPWTGEMSPDLIDADLFTAAGKAGFGRFGAHIGGVGSQPDLFTADMLAFHRSVLLS